MDRSENIDIRILLPSAGVDFTPEGDYNGSFLLEKCEMDCSEIAVALLKGRVPAVKEGVQQALDAGVAVETLLQDALLAPMAELGERFRLNQVFVPEVLIAARALKAGMELLKPRLAAAGIEPLATVVIGTVKGDLHDIGKNLVGMMIEGAGFRVIDAGIDVAPERFVALARENNAAIVGVSALLTTTMANMALVVSAVREAGIPARVIVGGAPVTQAFADEIGADGYSRDAASAAQLVKRLTAGC